MTHKHHVFINLSNKNDMLKLQKKLYNIFIKYANIGFDVLVQKRGSDQCAGTEGPTP